MLLEYPKSLILRAQIAVAVNAPLLSKTKWGSWVRISQVEDLFVMEIFSTFLGIKYLRACHTTHAKIVNWQTTFSVNNCGRTEIIWKLTNFVNYLIKNFWTFSFDPLGYFFPFAMSILFLPPPISTSTLPLGSCFDRLRVYFFPSYAWLSGFSIHWTMRF